jgi:hypothetical protein
MQVNIAKNEPRELLNDRIEQLNSDGFQSVQLAHFGDLNQDLINKMQYDIVKNLATRWLEITDGR